MCKMGCPDHGHASANQLRDLRSMWCCAMLLAVWNAMSVRPLLCRPHFRGKGHFFRPLCHRHKTIFRNADQRAVFQAKTNCAPPTSFQRAETPYRAHTTCLGNLQMISNIRASLFFQKYDRWKNAPYQKTMFDTQLRTVIPQTRFPQLLGSNRSHCREHRACGITAP